jgi:16S rRNA (guanine527-N7)-methyltransferase
MSSHTKNVRQVVDRESFSAVMPVSRETLDRLAAYESCLRKWQRSINLVSANTLDALWGRHFFDSAQLLPHLPEGLTRLVDLGSGGGFPGVVLAILLADRDVEIHLVDSDRRKGTFLREALRQSGARAEVHTCRIEDLDTGALGPVDVVTARACAPMTQLLDWAAAFFTPQTIGLFLKGQGVGDELTAAHKCWTFNAEEIPSRSDPAGTIVKLQGLARGNT